MMQNKEDMQQAVETKDSSHAQMLGELFETISTLPDNKLEKFAYMTQGFMICNAASK